ncbi:MAG: hypothetical protein U0805_02720 [Pirellulales bacterium]
MRRSLVGALMVASLVIALTATRSFSDSATSAPADTPYRASGSELFTSVTASNDGAPLTVTVIDPRTRVMAVYHVDRSSGEITPKSIRNITWDLQMTDFNCGKPLPQDVRNALQH